MKIYRMLKYYIHKKYRYIDSFFQDMIASKVNFIPYEIKLIRAEKKDSKQFNYFEFSYQGMDYILKDDDLQITIFDDK